MNVHRGISNSDTLGKRKTLIFVMDLLCALYHIHCPNLLPALWDPSYYVLDLSDDTTNARRE